MTEHHIDNHTVVGGKVVPTKSESGGKSYGVDDFYIMVYIRGIDHDITKAFEQKWIDLYKTDLIAKFMETE